MRSLERLGWSVEQAKEYLIAKYNKRSRRDPRSGARQLLDNEEIIEFWMDLRKM